MNILTMVIEQIDNPTKFIFLFEIFSVVALIIAHHFMYKKFKKLWTALCAVPLLVFIVFYFMNNIKGNPYLSLERYICLGLASVLTLIWGLAVYFRKSYVIYTVLLSVVSLVCIAESLIVIILIDYSPHLVNLSNESWSSAFEKTIDELESTYVSRNWKQIDFDRLRSELIPKVKKAEQNNDKAQFALALYELKYELYDGHIWVRISDPKVSLEVAELLSGNDYGFVMFKDNAGEYVAVLADEESESSQKGIHNGTVITKWDNIPVERAASQVKCLDSFYTFAYIENEEIFKPVFLSGTGGDEISVTFIDDNGNEKQVTLHKQSRSNTRIHNAISKVYASNYNNTNYYTCMLNESCGYLRINSESFYRNDFNEYLSALTGDYPLLREDIEAKIEELENKGMDRLIIDLRNNRGGYTHISQNIASLFVDIPMTPDNARLNGDKIEAFEKPRVIGNGRWSNIPIAVIVNGETCSAGDCLAYWLSEGKNTYMVGNTYQWGCAQGTGGTCILPDSLIIFDYPIFPSPTNNGELIAEPKSDRKARVALDYMITYDKKGVLELFSDSTEDYVLNKTIEYISSVK